jgi:hypothetical protein
LRSFETRAKDVGFAQTPAIRRRIGERIKSTPKATFKVGAMNGPVSARKRSSAERVGWAISRHSRSRYVRAAFSDAFLLWQTHEGGATVGCALSWGSQHGVRFTDGDRRGSVAP